MRFLKFQHVLLVYLLLALIPVTNAQKNYYVSTSGSDANTGLFTSPWKTVLKACNSIASGDTINIMAGTYNEMIPIYAGGDSVKGYRTLRNYMNDTVIIDGTGLNSRGIITIYNQNYIRISGLILQSAVKNDAIGFLVEGNCRNIEFTNNVVRQIYFSANASDAVTSSKNSHPILVNGINATSAITNLKITNNQVYNCRTGYSEGLTLNGNVDGFIVQKNIIHDITNIGIDIAGNYGICSNAANDQARNGIVQDNIVYNCGSKVATAAGIYVDGGRDVILTGNEVHNCQYGIEIGAENKGKTTSGIIVRDNIIFRNTFSGLVLGGYNYPSTGKVINSKLLNNTTYANDSTGNGGGELHLSYSENCQIENNIFYSDSKSLLATMEYQSTYVPVGLALDYNIWYTMNTSVPQFSWGKVNCSGFPAYQSTSGNESHSICTDPLLVDRNGAIPDLRLTEKSPAIDMGDPVFVPGMSEEDKSGSVRVKNERVDIGAFEFQNNSTAIDTHSGTIDKVSFSLGDNYPNPFNPSTIISFSVATGQFVTLKVYDILGTQVAVLVNEEKQPGTYSVTFSSHNAPSGIYFYRMQSGNFMQTKKLIVNK